MSERRKSRKELEEALRVCESEKVQLQIEFDRLKKNMEYLENKLIEINRYEDATPSDCKKGTWCATCQFARTFDHSRTANQYSRIRTVVCTKGEVCKQYIRNVER